MAAGAAYQDMNIHWEIKKFDALSAYELYAIFNLRLEVFVVEQACPYQDADGKDLKGYHLMGYDDQQRLIAYARLLPQNVSYAEVSIGRVVTSPLVRGKGAGQQLMKKALDAIVELFGNVDVRIGAQAYLQKFYESFGFVREGEEYLEDGIKHIIMLRCG